MRENIGNVQEDVEIDQKTFHHKTVVGGIDEPRIRQG